jgi:phosphoribosyl-AMP cyclohydrolase
MLEGVQFDGDGLIPVVVQEETTNEVLLLAFMNEAALECTLETRLATFWSRSRQKLWQKGETSGHVQEVVSLHVNCEGNSLLLRVRQRGEAACHDGYRSCYYRRLSDDGAWEVTQPRLFDPAAVYGGATAGVPDPLAEAFWRIYRAYEYLRDHDLEAVSGTSRRLRHPDQRWLTERIVQEASELVGVVAGTHAHTNPRDDTILEGRQVCYWLLLRAAVEHLTFEEIAPHKHLRAGFEAGDMQPLHAVFQGHTLEQMLLDLLHAGLHGVGWACRLQEVSLLALAEAELADLAQKPYLAEALAEE